jgi:cytochrome P450
MRASDATAANGAPLYPPNFDPPSKPLSLPKFAVGIATNPLRVVPETAYREPFVQYGSRFTWVTDPGLIKRILLDERDNFYKTPLENRILGPLLGNGLLLSSGADWKWQRQITAPVFRHAEVLRYLPAMVAAAEETIGRWRARPPGAKHAIDIDVSDATYRVISDTMLTGSDGAAFARAELDKVRQSWPLAYAVLGLPEWMPYPGQLTKRRAERHIRASVGRMVRARRANPSERNDLVARLLQARDPESGRPMEDEEIVDNLLTFLVAGHATTAKALMWSLYLVARAPAWEQRMLEEIVQVAGGGPIEPQHIDRLTVVTMVLKEAMRLYPPVPEFPRVARDAVDLGGARLKAGSFVFVPISAVHRHRRLWDDPDRFDPERFAPAREATYSRYQFMPFGGGPRTCIGASFSMVEAVAMLAMFVRAARFAVPEGFIPQPVSRVTLWSRNGMPLKVWMRDAAG